MAKSYYANSELQLGDGEDGVTTFAVGDKVPAKYVTDDLVACGALVDRVEDVVHSTDQVLNPRANAVHVPVPSGEDSAEVEELRQRVAELEAGDAKDDAVAKATEEKEAAEARVKELEAELLAAKSAAASTGGNSGDSE